jgi:hypothetical protein
VAELRRVDIITEVSKLASYMAMPHEGHMGAIFHLYGYLKKRHISWVVLDPTYPDIDMSKFQEHDWKQYYGDVLEPIPSNAPKELGKSINLHLFVDSDYAGNKHAHHS